MSSQIDLAAIRRLEAATISSWPSITSAMDGSWLARFARGYTKRANSIQCLDPDDDKDAAARLVRLANLYPLNSRDPIFRVTPLAGPGVLAALEADKWIAFEESRVLSMEAIPEFPTPGGLKIYEGADRNWIEGFGELSNADRRPLEILTQLVNLIAFRQAGLLLRDNNGDPLAAALAVQASGIGVYHNVVVRPNARGKGYGRAIMQAALNWTREAGATSAAIQVVSENAPAVRLYTSLGFSERYRYHYRRPQ